MRTTLQIDDDVLDAARAIADADQASLGAVISRLARQGMSRVPETMSDAGLPTFSVPPDAAIITDRMVTAALEE